LRGSEEAAGPGRRMVRYASDIHDERCPIIGGWLAPGVSVVAAVGQRVELG